MKTVSEFTHPRHDLLRGSCVRACYQHAVSQPMTNRSLRERFGLPETKTASVSQVISAAIDEGVIKPDIEAGESKRLACYLPFWA